MSVEDDIALFNRVPTLNLLGHPALSVLAIGAEYRNFVFGQELFRMGDESDCGYIVKHGSFRVTAVENTNEIVVGPGALIGEMAMMAPIRHSTTVMALEDSSVVRLSRSLFQRVLESHPEAARHLSDDIIARNTQAVGAFAQVRSKLT